MPKREFLGSFELARLLDDLPLKCLDIGARGGVIEDLLPISWAVDLCGFEPDYSEYDRLIRTVTESDNPWRSLRFIPVALGQIRKNRSLYLTRARGRSSFLEADYNLLDDFSRQDFYFLEDIVTLPTIPLDQAASEYSLQDAVYMKIDVEGLELEIIKSAHELISKQILAIKVEIVFTPIRKNQPTYADIYVILRKYGFVPMAFYDLIYWRPSTVVHHPALSDGDIPYSRGQLIHGDALFFRNPQTLSENSQETIELLLKLAFLFMTYEYVDHAAKIFRRPMVDTFVRQKYHLDIEKELETVSQTLANKYRKTMWHETKQNLKSLLKQLLGRQI